MRSVLILTVFIGLSIQGYSQFKYEKESRVKERDVPSDAINFVDSLSFSSKVRWFRETGFSSISFEAKTKHRGKRYSIEFSETGSFEDIEIEIGSNEMPSGIFNTISGYLSEHHPVYSIEKIQVQYSGKTTLIIGYFQNEMSETGLVKNFEIVISGKIDGSFTMLEYIFSETGEFVQKTPISLKRTDNIEY